jgi:hypothetical protein
VHQAKQGFNRPEDPATPGVSDQLVLSAGATGIGTLIAHNEAGDSAESTPVTITLS